MPLLLIAPRSSIQNVLKYVVPTYLVNGMYYVVKSYRINRIRPTTMCFDTLIKRTKAKQKWGETLKNFKHLKVILLQAYFCCFFFVVCKKQCRYMFPMLKITQNCLIRNVNLCRVNWNTNIHIFFFSLYTLLSIKLWVYSFNILFGFVVPKKFTQVYCCSFFTLCIREIQFKCTISLKISS